MRKKFKFRYANEVAGTFVIITLILSMAGIFMIGHSQGWLEGKFTIRTVFKDKDGSFGLQEGAEVQIMNTLAGRVGRIMPTEKGQMAASFIIQNRFKPFVSKDSIARVKKKFGLAGDSFVEIGRGSGLLIEENDLIECKRDEELLESAQKVLKQVQDVVLPVMEEVKEILHHINTIAGSIDEGNGIAGAVINDGEMAKDFENIMNNMNLLIIQADGMFNETKNLVKGVQKHWLIRKYMEKKDEANLILPGYLVSSHIALEFETNLKKARQADNSSKIARNAYNLAVYKIEEGDYDSASNLLDEARVELERIGEDSIYTLFLKSELSRKAGNLEEAINIASSAYDSIKNSSKRDVRIDGHLLMAKLYCDKGNTKEARLILKRVKRILKKTKSISRKAVAAGIYGRILMIEKKYKSAAVEFNNESKLWQSAGLYYQMARSMEHAGNAYEEAGEHDSATDCYFRAGRSMFSGGQMEDARKIFEHSVFTAGLSDNKYLIRQIADFYTKTCYNVGGKISLDDK